MGQDLNEKKPMLVSAARLHQEFKEVMGEVEDGRTLVVTNHGRFAALIVPVTDAEVIGQVFRTPEMQSMLEDALRDPGPFMTRAEVEEALKTRRMSDTAEQD